MPAHSSGGKNLKQQRPVLTIAVWAVLAGIILTPFVIAATSPYLIGRDITYVVAGLAGIAALCFLLIQPLLAAGYLPGANLLKERRWHRWIGSAIVVAVALHVGGLYITSPADALDALLLVSPTPFSLYGVIGMWAVILTALLVAFRSTLKLPYKLWNTIHNLLAVVVVIGTVVHALMIEGTMGTLSKTFLCVCVLAATATAIIHLRILKPMLQKQRNS